ncbi:MAG: thioesterase family protein, partial [Acidimicrobiales bacterium]
MSDAEPFFSVGSDGELHPRPQARSPWSPDMMHGRLLAGLAARHVEGHHRDDGLRPARLTTDLFRSPPMEPVVESSRVLRAGRRIKVVEVVQAIAEVEVARSVVVLMRSGEHPDLNVWTPDPWDVPGPDDVEAPPDSPMRQLTSLEIRAIDGMGMGSDGRRRVWLRDWRALVDGEAITSFQRLAMAADFASPLANSSSEGLRFINGDITVLVGRLPEGEWIGVEVGAHIGHEGIAVARCDLYDQAGRVAFVDVSAVTNAP